ncbi:hypothetical protein ACGFNU_01380 [Spirillospora sp. NPDC048911]|uniref:hypothetical protein n=1 Tax=Spirillospora sp. NPDC048911 TaxID=3364527 RepID=UPI00371AD8C6
MSEHGADGSHDGDRAEEIGKAVWAFNQLLALVPVVRMPGEFPARLGGEGPPQEVVEGITGVKGVTAKEAVAAYGSIIERAAARQREREKRADRPRSGHGEESCDE